MEIAIGFGREPGDDIRNAALVNVIGDDVTDKVTGGLNFGVGFRGAHAASVK